MIKDSGLRDGFFITLWDILHNACNKSVFWRDFRKKLKFKLLHKILSNKNKQYSKDTKIVP